MLAFIWLLYRLCNLRGLPLKISKFIIERRAIDIVCHDDGFAEAGHCKSTRSRNCFRIKMRILTIVANHGLQL